jgi:hypothetical protein
VLRKYLIVAAGMCLFQFLQWQHHEMCSKNIWALIASRTYKSGTCMQLERIQVAMVTVGSAMALKQLVDFSTYVFGEDTGGVVKPFISDYFGRMMTTTTNESVKQYD